MTNSMYLKKELLAKTEKELKVLCKKEGVVFKSKVQVINDLLARNIETILSGKEVFSIESSEQIMKTEDSGIQYYVDFDYFKTLAEGQQKELVKAIWNNEYFLPTEDINLNARNLRFVPREDFIIKDILNLMTRINIDKEVRAKVIVDKEGKIVSGNTRTLCAIILGLPFKIEVTDYSLKDKDEIEVLNLQLSYNVNTKVSAAEHARLIDKMKLKGKSEEQIHASTGLSIDLIKRYSKIDTQHSFVKELLDKGASREILFLTYKDKNLIDDKDYQKILTTSEPKDLSKKIKSFKLKKKVKDLGNFKPKWLPNNKKLASDESKQVFMNFCELKIKDLNETTFDILVERIKSIYTMDSIGRQEQEEKFMK